MHLPIEARIALRYLRFQSWSSRASVPALLTISGVSVGVAALIVVTSVWNGFEADFLEKALGFGAHTIVTRRFDAFENHREVAERMRAHPKVRQVAPFIYAQAITQSDRGAKGIVIHGIDPMLVSSTPLARHLPPEALQRLARADPPPILLGRGLQDSLHVDQGDEVALIIPHGDGVSTTAVRVAAVFETGMIDIDDRVVLMHLRSAQQLFGFDGAVTGLAVWTHDPMSSFETSREATSGAHGYSLSDWSVTYASFLEVLRQQKATIAIVLFIIIVVSAFNIMAALFLTVSQKRREIAILEALGATRRSIRMVFILKGQLVGLAGCAFGVVAGLTACLVLHQLGVKLDPRIHTLDHLPVSVRPLEVAAIVAGAMVLSTMGALLPASRAAKLDPIAALAGRR